MAIDVTTLALAQAYARNLLGGGTTAGKNVTIESIVAIDGGNRITFGYTDNDGFAQTKTLDVMDGKDGVDGKNGTNGTNGKDGISATHSWNGTVLSITSASGTSSADLKGEKGDKGDKGDTGAAGNNGTDGAKGEAGASIVSISLVKDENGDIVSGTATLTDDTIIDITITTA